MIYITQFLDQKTKMPMPLQTEAEAPPVSPSVDDE